MQVCWSGKSRYHDWFDKRRTVPRRMLSRAQRVGLIGAVDWISTAPGDERKRVEGADDVLERLLDHRPKRGELYRIAAGGAKPFAWRVSIGLFPFQKVVGQVRGYNIFNLWFEAEAFPGPDGSDALVKAFRNIHTTDNTEFAFIHPCQRWSELSDALNGRYRDPVTLGPMFTGVYWAIFLGREHLAFFDLAQLRGLQSYQVEWMDDDGLFVRVSRDIADATSSVVEEEMFRLTEIFQNAAKSEW